MKPTMQFRWVIRQNPSPNVEEVRAFSALRGVTLMQAKKEMINATKPVLQQWQEAEGWEHDDYVRAGGMWEDVPTVIEPHELA